MEEYIVEIDDRLYSKYSIRGIELNPIEHKLFHGDRFVVDSGVIKVTSSDVRNNILPGLLVLNKTYGRENKSIPGQTYTMSTYKKLGKLLYKFIPYDKHFPSFLVPYEIKKMEFSKVVHNLYVLVKYVNWEEDHPRGALSQIIGPINDLDNYYEYQLYCKGLNVSIHQFTKTTTNKIDDSFQMENVVNKYPNIENRTLWKTFTVDPSSCLDYDDGFSIRKEDNKTVLSIYISNVPLIIDYLGLWESFSERVSTIYLPNRKKPLLPSILTDDLCSLKKSTERLAFTLDIIMDDNLEILDIRFLNTLIKIKNNFVYESSELLNNNEYKQLLVVTQELNKKYPFTEQLTDSHEIVAYLMIFMNYQCAKWLSMKNNGIFRMTTKVMSNSMPSNVYDKLKFLNNPSSVYIDAETTPIGRHELLSLDAYVHITSPIRRIVDIMNMLKLQQNLELTTFSDQSNLFYELWRSKIEDINEQMRKIRNVQNNCALLEMIQNNEELLNVSYEGYIIEKLTNSYSVYIPSLKLITKWKSEEELDNYSLQTFKLYLFIDEDNFYKKIRLSKVN
jgi:exoribonuclease R